MFIDFNNLFRIQIRFIEKKEGNKRKDSVERRKEICKKRSRGGVGDAFFQKISFFKLA